LRTAFAIEDIEPGYEAQPARAAAEFDRRRGVAGPEIVIEVMRFIILAQLLPQHIVGIRDPTLVDEKLSALVADLVGEES
jgi:hypothetical protein